MRGHADRKLPRQRDLFHGESMPPIDRRRVVPAFALLFVLYQGAEGIGGRLLGQFWIQAAFMVAMLAIAWPVGRWLGFRGYDAYALEWRKAAPAWLAGGLVLALLTKYVAVCVGLALNVYSARAHAVMPGPVSFLTSIPWALLVTFVPSVAEDLLTRGFLWRAIRVRWAGAWTFVLASTVLYVFNHVYRLGQGPAEWVMLFCFGVAYATAVARTGSLWAAVGLHWGWNLANVLMADILPYDTVSPMCSALLSGGAHLMMLGLMFAVPVSYGFDETEADPA